MARSKKTPLELGKRERQVFETVMELTEASVTEVLEKLEDPPSYSAVRATLNFLVEKKWLKSRQVGPKYLYRSAAGKEKTRRSAAERLLSTFFGGSASEAVAALLDVSSGKLSDKELQDMAAMIQQAREEKQS